MYTPAQALISYITNTHTVYTVLYIKIHQPTKYRWISAVEFNAVSPSLLLTILNRRLNFMKIYIHFTKLLTVTVIVVILLPKLLNFTMGLCT